jgi:hypothetical protein
MKNIFKTIIFAFCLILAASCSNEGDHTKVVANGFALRATTNNSPVVLLPQNNSDPVVTLEWDKSDNGTSSVSTYIVEIADHLVDPNFTNPKRANLGNNVVVTNELRSYTIKVGELNTLINQLPGFVCGQPITVDIRVKSSLGAGYYNSFVQYSSNVITVNVTPYSSVLPTMSFATTAQIGALPQNMAASGVGATDYEGYIRLTPGVYNFYKPDACNGYSSPTMYGDDDSGSFNTLAVGGTGYTVVTTGNFRVIADTTTGLYSVIPITSWGVIGTAKVAFPGSSTNPAMAYDAVNNIYYSALPMNLHGGKTFRFRGNNIIVLAKFDPTKTGVLYGGPEMSYNGVDILVPGITDQLYDITLDLSSPRNYKYTLVLH